LFDHPVLRAAGSALPVANSTFDAAWSLGVLCTTQDQLTLLRELRRVVRLGAPVGLLVFVARRDIPADQLEDNHFPTVGSLTELTEKSSLEVEHWQCTADLPAIPQAWSDREDAVTEALTERYGHTRAWQLAERQSERIGRLLADKTLTGELLVLRAA
jgi:hypothetical protein